MPRTFSMWRLDLLFFWFFFLAMFSSCLLAGGSNQVMSMDTSEINKVSQEISDEMQSIKRALYFKHLEKKGDPVLEARFESLYQKQLALISELKRRETMIYLSENFNSEL